MKKRIIQLAVLLLVVALLIPLAACQKKEDVYPGNSPITIIVPWSAGGSVDTTARIYAPKLAEKLGTTVNVVNEPGGQSIPGTVGVLQSKPDGLTLLSDANGSNCIPVAWGTDVPFTAENRTYICNATSLPLVFAVAVGTGWTSLDDVAAAIQSNPEEVQFGWLGGTGGIDSQAAQFLKALNDRGIDTSKVNMITYAGGADLATAVAGGHVDFCSVSPTSIKSLADSGLANVISVTGNDRFHLFPDVPTTKEQGWDAVNFSDYIGLAGPEGLPDNIVKIIADAMEEILKEEAIAAEYANIGLLVDYMGAAAYRTHVLALTEELKAVKIG